MGIDRDAVCGGERGLGGGPPVAAARGGGALLAGAGDVGDGAGPVDDAHAEKAGVGDVQRAVEADGQPGGLTQQGRRGRPGVAAGRGGVGALRAGGSGDDRGRLSTIDDSPDGAIVEGDVVALVGQRGQRGVPGRRDNGHDGERTGAAASNRVDVGVGQAPRADAEQGAGIGGPGFGSRP